MNDRPEIRAKLNKKVAQRSINSKRMRAMLDERHLHWVKIQDAEHAKREVESEIVTSLIRDGDTSCITVNWRKLHKTSGWDMGS